VPTLYNRFRLPGVNLFSTTAVLVKSSVRFRYYHHNPEPASKNNVSSQRISFRKVDPNFSLVMHQLHHKTKPINFLVSNVDVSSIVNAKLIKCF